MVRENLKVLVEYHPFHESIKKKILADNLNFIRNPIVDGSVSNLRAERTVGEYYPKSVDLIKEWILTIIKQNYPGFDYSIDAWVAKYKDYLGIAPNNEADGVLQDIHWSIGAIGYFATYTIGNLLSVQLFDCARKEIEDLDADISKGNFDALLHWLRENIHCHGSKFTPSELVKRITGNSMDAQPYLNYLRNKYSEIYKL